MKKYMYALLYVIMSTNVLFAAESSPYPLVEQKISGSYTFKRDNGNSPYLGGGSSFFHLYPDHTFVFVSMGTFITGKWILEKNTVSFKILNPPRSFEIYARNNPAIPKGKSVFWLDGFQDDHNRIAFSSKDEKPQWFSDDKLNEILEEQTNGQLDSIPSSIYLVSESSSTRTAPDSEKVYVWHNEKKYNQFYIRHIDSGRIYADDVLKFSDYEKTEGEENSEETQELYKIAQHIIRYGYTPDKLYCNKHYNCNLQSDESLQEDIDSLSDIAKSYIFNEKKQVYQIKKHLLTEEIISSWDDTPYHDKRELMLFQQQEIKQH